MVQWKNEQFKGKITDLVETSEPWWNAEPDTKNKPNVVIVLFDDLGFSQLGSYGSDISTPNIDELADNGLRYNNFHTTALCSPTRASLLTGRNPHSTGVSKVSVNDTGFPNNRGKVGKDTALLSEILVDAGYNTFAVGKWHLHPGIEQSFSGPFDNWPLGRGFEHYYGFLGGATSQWNPDLVEDNRRVKQPKTPEQGYHLTEDLTDKFIDYVREQKTAAPDKPFFGYVAYGATHAPHHTPKEFIDKYKGKYDKGWDQVRKEWFEHQKELGIVPQHAKLPPLSPDVKPWDELSADEKRLFARQQEVFAGFLEHTDYHIGRIIQYLKEINQFDNTIFVLLSDNGACAMGGETGQHSNWASFGGPHEPFSHKLENIDDIGSPYADNHYARGWAHVGNTPLRLYKSFVHAGGIKDPLIIHYPKKIKDPGGIREQYHHVSDIVPTILELLDLEAPKEYKGVTQKPIEGTSLAYTLEEKDSETKKETQVYEMVGNRAIYHNGWKAVAKHIPGTSFGEDTWELYNVDKDFSELNNLAESHSDILAELIDLWWHEARRTNILPLKDRILSNSKKEDNNNSVVERVFYRSEQGLPISKAPDIRNKSYEIKAKITRKTENDEGVLVAAGGRGGGYSLYIQNNRLVFGYNHYGYEQYEIKSDSVLPIGSLALAFRFQKTSDNEGIGTLFINGTEIGTGKLIHTSDLGFSMGLFNIGRNDLTPVTNTYETPYRFMGEIESIVYIVSDPQFDIDSLTVLEIATE